MCDRGQTDAGDVALQPRDGLLQFPPHLSEARVHRARRVEAEGDIDLRRNLLLGVAISVQIYVMS